MTEPSKAQASQSHPPAVEPGAGTPDTVWQRLQRHKVLQWTLAYAAAAYTVLHATQMVVESFDWPHLIVRVVALGLVLALPVVVLLAWYHGHKAQHRFSTAELSLLTVLLLIAGTVMWGFTRKAAGTDRATAAGSQVASASHEVAIPVPRTSIAVMPFANLTGDPSKDYLGDGMAEELIDTLGKVPGFKVPARTSSFAYKGRNVDVRQIARDLGVGAILEGSVRSAGERIRIDALLVSGQDGLRIWSDSYDRQFTDIFKLQDELAHAIAQALQTMNGGSPPEVASAPPTQDVEAYRLYLQAESLSRFYTLESEQRAIALYDQALARDPRFARAWWGRGSTRVSLVLLPYPMHPTLEDGERDAKQALALDPNLADAHALLGVISATRGDWIRAEESFRVALAESQNDPGILVTHAIWLLETAGQLRKANSELSEAYRLAPADPYVAVNLAAIKSMLGLHADAVRLTDLAIDLGWRPPTTVPEPQIRRNAAVNARRYEEAGVHITGALPEALLAVGAAATVKLVYSAMGEPEKRAAATQALQALIHRASPGALPSEVREEFILEFNSLGALDAAYQFANESMDEFARSGTAGGPWAGLWIPEMRPFRQDPRFQPFVTRLYLVDFWRQYGPPDDCDLKGNVLACR